MSVVVAYLIYLIISVGLTVVVARALARSGRAFLLEKFGGNDNLAEAVNNLLVVGFCLLNLGYVTLTMRTSGNIDGARQGLQLLSVKIGQVLLVLGALHFANLAIFARLRRSRAGASPASGPTESAAGPVAEPGEPALWRRPTPQQPVH